jgi:Flp pilus assembly protein TadD
LGLPAHHFIGPGYLGKRMYREATAELERARALAGDNLLVQANLGFAYAQAGDSKQAERVLADFERLAATRYVSP